MIGYGLLAISCIAWILLPSIPFLPLTTETKITWGSGVFIFAEITWWLAIPLLGKEVIAYWQRFSAWIKGLYRQAKR